MTIEVENLTKRFGRVTAVTDLSFSVQPGRVTGFLGPNGSGKTTTLRCLLGLVRPTSGMARFDGRPYAELANPTRTVGAALEATGFNPGRTAANHLRVIAQGADLLQARVPVVLEQVGLLDVADRKVGGFSLGMRQRLALAAALLGEPSILILDEPANGLDPEGIAWLRAFIRYQASLGVTVLISSHVLREVQQTVDDVVIIRRGTLAYAGTLDGLAPGGAEVIVRSPQADKLAAAITSALPASSQRRLDADGISVIDATAAQIGNLAHRAGLELHELRTLEVDLESIFLAMTSDGPA